MHFALPPRKTSQPPPYARASRSSPIRRKQLQIGGLIACGILVLIYLSTYLFSSGSEHIPSGTPEIVVVTVLDEATMSNEYKERIKENRSYYAKKQGMCFESRMTTKVSDKRREQATPLSSQKSPTTILAPLQGAGQWYQRCDTP